MTNVKYSMKSYAFYDRSGIQNNLEKQAEKGWLLENIGPVFWKYRRIEPQKLNYSVAYFPKASAFDPEPQEEQKIFIDFCEHTGWKLAASSGKMQIFYNENENPVPIETDPLTELESIHKSMKSTSLPGYVVIFILTLLVGFMGIHEAIKHPLDIITSNEQILYYASFAILFIACAIEAGAYFNWRRKAIKVAESEGIFTDTWNHNLLTRFLIGIVIITFTIMLACGMNTAEGIMRFVSVIVTITAIFSIAFASYILKKMKISTDTHRSVYMLLCLVIPIALSVFAVNRTMDIADERRDVPVAVGFEWSQTEKDLPLLLTDLAERQATDDNSYHRYETKNSFLASMLEAEHISFATPVSGVSYRVVKVKQNFVYEKCLTALLKDIDHNIAYAIPDNLSDEEEKIAIEIDSEIWGAEEAYQLQIAGNPHERYLLCYDDRIIEIDFDIDITNEQAVEACRILLEI
ncbi:MAG: DUF2812 domain-containing protein [Clostridiales bacterium]|nr:DUF2812 domain-containing protein [Clostridiales bacterium]